MMNTKMIATMVVRAMTTKVTRIMAITMMKTIALKGMVISDFDYDIVMGSGRIYTSLCPLSNLSYA